MSRLLPPSEWHRLTGTLLDPAWKAFNPLVDKVMAVEHKGEIVACSALFQVWHLEGTWVHPQYRQKVSVARRGIRLIRDVIRALHIGEVFMMATSPRTAKMCRRMGQAMPLAGEHFAVVVNGKQPVWAERL